MYKQTKHSMKPIPKDNEIQEFDGIIEEAVIIQDPTTWDRLTRFLEKISGYILRGIYLALMWIITKPLLAVLKWIGLEILDGISQIKGVILRFVAKAALVFVLIAFLFVFISNDLSISKTFSSHGWETLKRRFK